MVPVCLAPESWFVSISTEEHFMAAKKKSVLARRVNELEDAVTRLFTGEPPAAKPAKRKKAKRKASKIKKAAKKVAGKVKKAAKKVARKAKRKAKKARR
jgi:predicted S18 family serine protease